MKYILSLINIIFLSILSFSQNSEKLTWLDATDLPLEILGNLSQGQKMNDISWAWNSSNACFPQTQSKKFSGHHVLYAIDLPTYTEYEITLIPKDKNSNFSLYAYQVGTITNANIVPNLPSCLRCEADHKWDYKKKDQVQDHTRKIRDILATTNSYQVIIGVAGAEGLAEGKYELVVQKRN